MSEPDPDAIDTDEFFAELCDAAARVLYDVPDDDPMLHTSTPARAIAMRVLEVLDTRGLYHWTRTESTLRDATLAEWDRRSAPPDRPGNGGGYAPRS